MKIKNKSTRSWLRNSRLALLSTMFVALTACNSLNSPTTSKTIKGLVQEKNPLAQADVYITDHRGNEWRTTTDAKGYYTLSLPNDVLPPLTLTAVSEKNRLKDCVRNDVLRPICLVASVLDDEPNLIANINPLTDRLASDYAKHLNLQGPQQLFHSAEPYKVNPEDRERALDWIRKSFGNALNEIGVANAENFDPVRDPSVTKNVLAPIFSLLNHNRTYDNTTGLTGHTTLTDSRFKPIVGLFHGGNYEPFDFKAARQHAKKIENARTRIFFVGDSTSAMYEQFRFPRMGWGEAFMEQFSHLDEVAIVVGSRAGRSSRDFYNGRWFAQMESMIKPGDYVFINHGHNDQNCDAARPVRGLADVTNLCTYPNTADGKVQHPDANPDMSFDRSISRYIEIVKSRGAHPVLFTPSARILNEKREQKLPVAPNHFTQHQPQKDYAFVGNYAQTLRQIAARENLPIIDLEAESIDFANTLSGNEWWNYWLVVDPAINAYYANGAAGSPQSPDGTHFQAKGAHAMASIVARAIANNPELTVLHQLLASGPKASRHNP